MRWWSLLLCDAFGGRKGWAEKSIQWMPTARLPLSVKHAPCAGAAGFSTSFWSSIHDFVFKVWKVFPKNDWWGEMLRPKLAVVFVRHDGCSPSNPGAVRQRRATLYRLPIHTDHTYGWSNQTPASASWLTQFAPVCFPFHAGNTSRQTDRQTWEGWCRAGCEAWNNGESSDGGGLPSCNEKQRQPLPWQLAGALLQEDPDLPSATDCDCIVLGCVFDGAPAATSPVGLSHRWRRDFMWNHGELSGRWQREYPPSCIETPSDKDVGGWGVCVCICVGGVGWAVP